MLAALLGAILLLPMCCRPAVGSGSAAGSGPVYAARAEAKASPAPTGKACVGLSAFERVEIDSGKSVTSPSRLTVSYRGLQHDSYSGGRTDQWVELHFERSGQRLERGPSLFAPPKLEQLLGHCWRLVESSGQRVVVELALIAPARR